MAGAQYSVYIDDDEIHQRLNKLLEKGTDLTPAFATIGEDLLISHHQRFLDQISPEGVPWAPLSKTTKALKTKNVDTILVFNDFLRSTLNYQPSPESLLFGSPLEYAATHQFGRETAPNSMIPNKEIPARPFLGIDEGDRDMILDNLSDFLMNR
ncbi:phage virion morphogenesis protein [Vibrio furnissii]|uniref:phage virion morphogenesis protein n=1 Tax=Vibrio furnissii TaxID=29494 RepID=UPI002572308B|nr:phage virion morphogenesis protein [Vibrio furnissii]WJG22154.1 phage virion morphogenesis protein [Vibrio furnissii]